MAYTNISAVQTLLGPNYGPNPDGTFPDLGQFISSAHIKIKQMIVCAAKSTPPYVHSDEELEMIERWVAAHDYTKLDPLYSSKSNGASGSFIGPGQANEAERYKDGAIGMDPSGCMRSILNLLRARAIFLGNTC